MATGNNSAAAGVRRFNRPRKDLVTIIKPSAFKEQLTDTSDIVIPKKLAPRTKKEMANLVYENLESFFTLPGRRITGRPLQKLTERHLSAVKNHLKLKFTEENIKYDNNMKPLGDDLKTPGNADAPSNVTDICPPHTQTFPSRNPADVRKSYAKKTPKRDLPIFQSFTAPSLVTYSKSKSSKTVPSSPPKFRALSNQRQKIDPLTIEYEILPSSSNVVSMSPQKLMTLSGEGLAQIPQFSNEISIDNSSNTEPDVSVVDMSDLIQIGDTNTQIDGKIEIASTEDLVLCTGIDDMSEVIVMGQDGERYRFVALEDGRVSLVAESEVQ